MYFVYYLIALYIAVNALAIAVNSLLADMLLNASAITDFSI
jgi:hypothetical protein